MSVRYLIAQWLAYLVGEGIHTWMRADLSRASSLNGITTYRQYFLVYKSVIAFRFFCASMIFLGWQGGNNLVSETMQYLPFFKGVLDVSKAGIFGLCADYVLDYVAVKLGLSREIPPEPGGEGIHGNI